MGIEDARHLVLLGRPFYLYGLFISLGALAYLLGTHFFAKKRGFVGKFVLYYGAWLLPISWFFARLFYVLIRMGYFANTISRPSAMMDFFQGGYSMVGALVGMIVASFGFCRVHKLSFGGWMDVAVAPLGLFLAFARFGETFTLNIGRGKTVGEGLLSRLPFFVIDDFAGTPYGGAYSLAVFRYEAVAGVVLFLLAIILFFSKAFSAKARKGDLALLVLSVFGTFQVLFESLRDDGHMLWGFVRMSQVLSIFFPVVAGVVFTHRAIKEKKWSRQWLISWLAVLAGIGIGIYEEFQIDVSPNLAKEYLIMLGALVILLLGVCWMWHKTTENKKKTEGRRA